MPGNQADVDNLKKQYDTTGTAQLDTHYEAHTIAGLLKLWFRELPEPVLIFRYYETFIRVGSTTECSFHRVSSNDARREPRSNGAQNEPAHALDWTARSESIADIVLDGIFEGTWREGGERGTFFHTIFVIHANGGVFLCVFFLFPHCVGLISRNEDLGSG